MRGKKTVLEDEHYKRALMGFQGMRGKKSLEEVNIHQILNINNVCIKVMLCENELIYYLMFFDDLSLKFLEFL